MRIRNTAADEVYNEQRGTASARGYGADWQRLRTEYIQKHPVCGCGAPATEVHHIIALAAGGNNDESNLASLCHSCHMLHHAGKARRALTASTGEDGSFSGELLESDDYEQIRQALFEAALSGNVKAIELWLERHGPRRDAGGAPDAVAAEGTKTSRKTRRARDFWSIVSDG